MEHLRTVQKGPPIPDYYDIPYVLSMKSPTFKEVTEHLIRKVGGSKPTFPFPTQSAFCNWGSAEPLLQDIKVPFLSINAEVCFARPCQPYKWPELLPSRTIRLFKITPLTLWKQTDGS